MLSLLLNDAFFLLAERLSVRYAPVSERAKACKEAKGNKKHTKLPLNDALCHSVTQKGRVLLIAFRKKDDDNLPHQNL